MPGWFLILLMVVMFFTSLAFWCGVSESKKYSVDGVLMGTGVTVFNNTGGWIEIAGFQIGQGELKNIGCPRELISKTK